jgi:aspartate/methionine/tyrosine aminotransferase
MHWAKRRVANAPYSLGTSGVSEPPEAASLELRAQSERARPFSSPENYYGIPTLRAALVAAYDAHPDGVLVSEGTSLANYTALAVLCGPGDRVLVESPTYPALHEIPRFLGATVERLPRDPAAGWSPSLADIERAAGTPNLRLVVLTRLHNPTGTELAPEFLERLAALAERHDFHVLLDEVYLDFIEGARPGHHYGPRFVSTGSLTKVYGFGGLRVGWVIGDPTVIDPMRELSFYLAVDGATTSQRIATTVIEARARYLARSREIARVALDTADAWIRARDDVSWVRPVSGLIGLVHLHRVADTRAFAARLFDDEGVAIAEGEFFSRPGWIRIALGADPERVEEAFRRLGRALDRV